MWCFYKWVMIVLINAKWYAIISIMSCWFQFYLPFPRLYFPFPWSVPEADEKRLSHVQGQGWREWKRKISCTIPPLTGSSFLMVYVHITRRRFSFLPLKNRSKTIASTHSSLTIFHWFWKIWRVYSQCPSYGDDFAVPGGLEQAGLTRTVKNSSSNPERFVAGKPAMLSYRKENVGCVFFPNSQL